MSERNSGLEGRPVVVTGAARGIGRAIAERFVAAGAAVALVDREPAVASVAEDLGAVNAIVDLADVTATRAALAALIDRIGGCWCLVNNAGVFAKTSLLDIETDEFDRLMAVNARSVLTCSQMVAPTMIAAGGGRIVNMASMAAKNGTPGESSYAASKAAVVALTRIAAQELGPHGITVNAVCPGYVLTDLGADGRDAAQVAAWTAQSPLGRLATPDDVAAVVVHLAGDEAGYITGQAHNVTGGMCTW